MVYVHDPTLSKLPVTRLYIFYTLPFTVILECKPCSYFLKIYSPIFSSVLWVEASYILFTVSLDNIS